jgi:hypothetical protein
MKMNLANYENALSEVGFNLKTKALKSIIKNNTKTFDLLKVNLTSFGEPDASANVWAAMLLNYHLNGSTPNLGGIIGNKAYVLINERTDADKRARAFDYFKSTVAPKTFNRWATALAIIERVAKDEKQAPQDDVKDLTLAEIQALLGYKIRIVA